MADRGMISKDTLTAIANAIRAKTETSDTMLPGEMAARIASIETRSPLALTEGTFYQASQTQTAFLGAAIDVSEDYFIQISIVGNGSYNSNYNFVKTICQYKIGGVTTTEVTYSVNTQIVTDTNISVTVSADGTITCDNQCYFDSGDTYEWMFICSASS